MSEQEISFSLGMLTMWAMFAAMGILKGCKRAIKERKEFTAFVELTEQGDSDLRRLTAKESLSVDIIKKKASEISQLLDKNPIKSK